MKLQWFLGWLGHRSSLAFDASGGSPPVERLPDERRPDDSRHRWRMLALPLLVVACGVDPQGSELAGPDTVASQVVPALGPTVYQREIPRIDAAYVDSITRALLRGYLPVVEVWSPLTDSPCRALCATENIIVRLETPDDRIRLHGFDTSAGTSCINCGVEEFLHFRIVR